MPRSSSHQSLHRLHTYLSHHHSYNPSRLLPRVKILTRMCLTQRHQVSEQELIPQVHLLVLCRYMSRVLHPHPPPLHLCSHKTNLNPHHYPNLTRQHLHISLHHYPLMIYPILLHLHHQSTMRIPCKQEPKTISSNPLKYSLLPSPVNPFLQYPSPLPKLCEIRTGETLWEMSTMIKFVIIHSNWFHRN